MHVGSTVSKTLACTLLDPQPTYTTMKCFCLWAPLSSSVSGTYSHGTAEGVTYFPRVAVAPLLPAVLSPPAQAQMGRQSTLNSATHQKISTKFVYHPNRWQTTKNSVTISDICGSCSTVTCLLWVINWPIQKSKTRRSMCDLSCKSSSGLQPFSAQETPSAWHS